MRVATTAVTLILSYADQQELVVGATLAPFVEEADAATQHSLSLGPD